MKQKEILFQSFHNQWTPLIHKALSENNITGLDRDDLLQEILLVLWECFTKDNVQFPPTYYQRSIANRIADLHWEADRYYYPSTNLKCVCCGFIVACKPKSCECGSTRWAYTKGQPVSYLDRDIPFWDKEVEEFPKEIEQITEQILSGKKTGYKQKQLVMRYMKWQD